MKQPPTKSLHLLLLFTTFLFIPLVSLRAGAQYFWGEDEPLDETVIGIPPFGVDGTLRFDSRSRKLFFEGTLHVVGDQDRIARTRGEIPTGGYLTADITAGVKLWHGVELRTGVINLTDEFYVNHLNAKNPFTQQPIPEPGRVIFTNLMYAF